MMNAAGESAASVGMPAAGTCRKSRKTDRHASRFSRCEAVQERVSLSRSTLSSPERHELNELFKLLYENRLLDFRTSLRRDFGRCRISCVVIRANAGFRETSPSAQAAAGGAGSIYVLRPTATPPCSSAWKLSQGRDRRRLHRSLGLELPQRRPEAPELLGRKEALAGLLAIVSGHAGKGCGRAAPSPRSRPLRTAWTGSRPLGSPLRACPAYCGAARRLPCFQPPLAASYPRQEERDGRGPSWSP